MSGYAQDIPSAPPAPTPPRYLSHWKGLDNLLHHQIKLRISTSNGRLENQERLTQIHLHFLGGGWVPGATAGAKAPVPRGVQAKEGSPL